MKKILVTLAVVTSSMLAFAQSGKEVPVKITIVKSVEIDKSDGFGKYFNDFEIESAIGRCSMEYVSLKPTKLEKGQSYTAKMVSHEKEVRKDADSITKEGTTQYSIFSISGRDDIQYIGANCYTGGFLFPTLGLPTVKELVQKTKEFIIIK